VSADVAVEKIRASEAAKAELDPNRGSVHHILK
jgi:hypothetical protein